MKTMRLTTTRLLMLGSLFLLAFAPRAQTDYKPGPESMEQPGVPKGDIIKFTFDQSKVFPGTTRECSVYVPKQYDPATPACLFVCQDGDRFRIPIVLDNLIAKKDLPVIVGVFITPGVVKSKSNAALDRFNRSLEYDGLGGDYLKFLNTELLPAVETHSTPDGRAIHLSKKGNDRAIGGASSGAIAAFTCAWEDPNSFSRVFSSIGTYVGLRGGDAYPILIRKTEPKPIRIFLQDGSNDNNKYGGDWWMANQTMERALKFAGYEVNHVWGDNGHKANQATMIFPDAMRWLWKDWPAPIPCGQGSTQTQELLIPGEGWQLAGEGYGSTDGVIANAQGEIFFNDGRNGRSWKIGLDGKPTESGIDNHRGGGQAFGPDGKLYLAVGREQRVIAYANGSTSATTIAEGIKGNDLAVAHNGNIYVTESGDEKNPSKIWLIKQSGEKSVVDSGLKFANGITLSPDQSLLYVSEYRSHWVVSYQIQDDGSLGFKQRYYHLHAPDTADDSAADGMRVDRDGRLYVTTNMGIQVCDQAGRVNVILPTPGGRVSSLGFGGKNFDTIFAACGDKIYKRKVKVTGTYPYQEPNKPAPPKL